MLLAALHASTVLLLIIACHVQVPNPYRLS